MKLDVHIYDEVDEASVKFAVIIARHAGQLVLCRHAERDTWEIPGGHRELGESPFEAAKRELQEETGALDFELEFVSYYSVTGANRANASGEETFGALFRAEIATFGDIKSEIAEIAFMDALPHNLTYPEIQPLLLAKADELSIREGRK